MTTGPRLWESVLTALTIPITTVRSVDRTAPAKKACLGAWSLLFVVERKVSIAIAIIKLLGSGIGACVIDAGIWVKDHGLDKTNAADNGRSNKVQGQRQDVGCEEKENPDCLPSYRTYG